MGKTEEVGQEQTAKETEQELLQTKEELAKVKQEKEKQETEILQKFQKMQEELESLKAQKEQPAHVAAMMKEFMAAQKKEEEIAESKKQAIFEKNLFAVMEKEKQDTVTVTLPIDINGEDSEVFVGVNGYNYLIKRGEPVEVPKFVAEVLANSEKQMVSAIRTMNSMEQAAEEKMGRI